MHTFNHKLNSERFRVQFITNQWSEHSIPYQVEKACQGGCKWIQLRLKDTPNETFQGIAFAIKKICEKYQATFIVNDQVEIALKVGAEGVHLGKDDMDPQKAKEILGKNKIIGATANTLDDILILYEKGVDYFGLGPLRSTFTKKKKAPVLGIDGYKKILNEMEIRNIDIPVAAIGGIVTKDMDELLKTGVSGLAISSLISHNEDPEQITHQIMNELKNTMAYVKNRK
ncbi:MAG: thiamine phosphate synthase [Bacteroidales bacterium]